MHWAWVSSFMLVFVLNGVNGQAPFILALLEDKIVKGEAELMDDFTGNTINQELWYNYYPWGGLSLDAKTYTDPTMATQKAGILELKVDTVTQWRNFPDWMVNQEQVERLRLQREDKKLEIKRLTSALWSKETFKYGYFECRCWLPRGQGYWPAFWLYGGKPNEEIDIIEAKGERDRSYHVDVHCPNRCDRVRKWGVFDQPFGHWVKTKEKITETWITLAGLWTPEGVFFYYNDKLVAWHEASFVTEMNLIANFSLAMDNGPFSPGPNRKTRFPQQYKIDYIRAWSVPGLNSEGTASLRSLAWVRCVPEINQRIRFEFANLNLEKHKAWIEKDGIPFMELDVTSSYQIIDYSYWGSGTYNLRVKNNNQVQESLLVIKP